MGRSAGISKEAREYIQRQLQEYGEIPTDEIMDMIRPHYVFDPVQAKEQQIRRAAQGLMARQKDSDGVRTCFAVRMSGKSIYVNVDRTKRKAHLDAVEQQLKRKYEGLNASMRKVRLRRSQLDGQISLFGKEVS